jgi:hypothetical protein
LSTDSPPAAIAIPDRGVRIDSFVVTALASHGTHAIVCQARADNGSFVALKFATTNVGAQLVEHEERLLRGLGADSMQVPDFVGAGSANGQRYCASSWMPGVDARVAAAELRDRGSSTSVLLLCCRVARSYAALHARGMVHGQVHPRHVLVDADGAVALLDFSVAASNSNAPPAGRVEARFNTLGAPEQAEALLRGQEATLTAAAEQYSVAALIYLLVTGRMYARVRLERETLARDVVDAAVLPFSQHGQEASPLLENVLGRALQKDPLRRYESMAALADALEPFVREAAAPRRAHFPVAPALANVLATFRKEAASEAAISSLVAPTCSINFGAAGVAFALTRLGTVTRDAIALEHAERWLAVAERRSTDADAFDDGDELTPQTIGVVSPFHTASGVAAARAFLAAATGDHARQQAALDDFRTSTGARCENLDLTLGRSSVLLVASLLLARTDSEWPSAQRLESYGDELCGRIWRDATDAVLPYYGIAHGLAGVAYATMMWSRARGAEPPPGVRRVLDMLAGVAEPYERGVRWPISPADGTAGDEFWVGWCHGNAGYVFLWNLAEATYRDPLFAELAERAAWLTDGSAGVTSLCCGTAGQAYAALNQYKSTGENRWLALAVRLAHRGATEDVLAGDATTPLSLYKGDVGLALLAAELECPERAAMPLFEFEPA